MDDAVIDDLVLFLCFSVSCTVSCVYYLTMIFHFRIIFSSFLPKVVSNELRERRTQAQSTSGWDRGESSSTTAFCEAMPDIISIALCKMTTEHLIGIIDLRSFDRLNIAPSLTRKDLRTSLVRMLERDSTFRSVWTALKSQGEDTIEELTGMPHVQVVGASVCERLFSCSPGDASSKKTKRQAKNIRERIKEEKRINKQEESAEDSLDASSVVLENMSEQDGSSEKKAHLSSVLNIAIGKDNENECLRLDAMRITMKRWISMEQEAFNMKSCYICEAHSLQLREQVTTSESMVPSPDDVMDVQEASAMATERVSMEVSAINSICTKKLTQTKKKNVGITLQDALKQCGDPRATLKISTTDGKNDRQKKKTTSTNNEMLLFLENGGMQQQYKGQKLKQAVKMNTQTTRIATPATSVAQSRITQATVGVPLSCEQSDNGSGGGGGGGGGNLLGPTRQDVASASKIMECLKSIMPGTIVAEMNSNQCKDTVMDVDAGLRKEEQMLAASLGRSPAKMTTQISKVLNLVGDWMQQVYDQNSNVRMNAVVDSEILSKLQLHPNDPICVGLGMCTMVSSQRSRAFLRSKEVIMQSRSGEVSEDDFIPPGWEE